MRGDVDMEFSFPTGKEILVAVAVLVIVSALAGAGVLKLIQIM